MEALAKELTGSPIGYAPGDQATGASMHCGACSMGASVAAAAAVAVVMTAAAAAAAMFTAVDRCDGFITTTAPAPASTSGGPAQRCTAHERDSSVNVNVRLELRPRGVSAGTTHGHARPWKGWKGVAGEGDR